MTIESLKSEILKLDKLARIAFVQFILESLAEEERQKEDLFELSEDDRAVILKRMEEIKSGAVTAIPHKDVEKRIRKKYGFDS